MTQLLIRDGNHMLCKKPLKGFTVGKTYRRGFYFFNTENSLLNDSGEVVELESSDYGSILGDGCFVPASVSITEGMDITGSNIWLSMIPSCLSKEDQKIITPYMVEHILICLDNFDSYIFLNSWLTSGNCSIQINGEWWYEKCSKILGRKVSPSLLRLSGGRLIECFVRTNPDIQHTTTFKQALPYNASSVEIKEILFHLSWLKMINPTVCLDADFKAEKSIFVDKSWGYTFKSVEFKVILQNWYDNSNYISSFNSKEYRERKAREEIWHKEQKALTEECRRIDGRNGGSSGVGNGTVNPNYGWSQEFYDTPANERMW